MHTQQDPDKLKMKEENLKRFKHTIIVMSGKGGVGKSTIAVNLAAHLMQKGKKVGILDVDLHGPSMIKMTGLEGIRFTESGPSGLIRPIKTDRGMYVLSVASILEHPDTAVVWRGPMKIGVINQMFEDFDWPELDYLVVDCPPGTGDEPLTIIQTFPNAEGCIIVTTPQDMALLDVRKSIDFAQKLKIPILGIVENMSGFVCPHCGERVDIFKSKGAGQTGLDFGVDILGEIPIEQAIVHSGDDGKPFTLDNQDSEAAKSMINIVEQIIQKVEKV